MKLRLAGISIAAVSLLLAGCSSEEFETEAEKRTAFADYVCARDVNSEVALWSGVTTEVLSDPASSPEEKAKALQVMTVDHSVIDGEWEYYKQDPTFEPMTSYRIDPESDGNCYGWVWEKHLEIVQTREYAEFTYSDARDAGVL